MEEAVGEEATELRDSITDGNDEISGVEVPEVPANVEFPDTATTDEIESVNNALEAVSGSPDAQELIKDLVPQLDMADDGAITEQEAEAFLGNLGNLNDAQIEGLFAQNGISPTEPGYNELLNLAKALRDAYSA
ncbi:hypothetical protein [Bacillus thermotolerans]|uniref:Uncharacterized protein n=1 Tax=Bacillus thermotolerans TaxID=1221996 RepID=A0A0F5I6P1_BACTR|nr:hypothetical protein [Bacillus thermotolerans]KKB40960.1 hypothetical protein QY95_01023 [Bacillus thermotolerans]KKB44974.1 hypothetical protein QY96_00098 [Bacillus thermotolerans]